MFEDEEDEEPFDLFAYDKEHILVPFIGVIMYAALIVLIFSLHA